MKQDYLSKLSKILLLIFVCLLFPKIADAYDFCVDGIYYKITSSKDMTVEVTYKEFHDIIYHDPSSITIPSNIYIYYNGLDDEELNFETIYYVSGYSGTVKIPVSVSYEENLYMVTGIGEYAFAGGNISSVTIPYSVTNIGEYAFAKCTGLTSLIIPYSVTKISDYAFSECENISYITCNAATPPICDSYTFYNVKKTIPVYVPAEYASIYKSAIIWAAFTNIKDMIASGACDDNLTWILDGAGLLKIMGTGRMNTVRGVPWESYCQDIKNIEISQGITSVGYDAFYKCTNLPSATIPNSVTKIEYGAFSECTSLNNITIPNSVTSIGDQAFECCTSLTDVIIPSSVTSIGQYGFKECI